MHERDAGFFVGQGKTMSQPTKQEMLKNVDAAINARMEGGAVQSYSIGGRNLQYISLAELIKLRSQLRQEIAAGSSRSTYARFDNPV